MHLLDGEVSRQFSVIENQNFSCDHVTAKNFSKELGSIFLPQVGRFKNPTKHNVRSGENTLTLPEEKLAVVQAVEYKML